MHCPAIKGLSTLEKHKALGTGIVRSARIVSCMRATPVVACASVFLASCAHARERRHAHYYSRDCGLLQSGTLLHHHVRLRGQRCQWVMWGNAWDTGEREISWRQDLWTRTSRKPVAPFSTMAALGYFREISAPSPQNQCWSAVSSLSYSTDARTGF